MGISCLRLGSGGFSTPCLFVLGVGGGGGGGCLELSVGVLFHGASGWGWVLPRYLLPKSASYLKFSVTCDATYIYQVYK